MKEHIAEIIEIRRALATIRRAAHLVSAGGMDRAVVTLKDDRLPRQLLGDQYDIVVAENGEWETVDLDGTTIRWRTSGGMSDNLVKPS